MDADPFLLGVEGQSPRNMLHLALGSGLLLVLVTRTDIFTGLLFGLKSYQKGGHIRGTGREVTTDMGGLV